jgi:hypothetical protein
MREYIERLAAAHRAGYKQTPENNWIRLRAWEQSKVLDIENQTV